MGEVSKLCNECADIYRLKIDALIFEASGELHFEPSEPCEHYKDAVARGLIEETQ